MKVVIAPDSFKGSLEAPGVAEAIARGIRRESPEVETVLLPVADGGEGTVEAVRRAFGGEVVTVTVHDPLMREIEASFLLAGERAVIEMAAASGLPLLSEEERDVWRATSYGTGELIAEAVCRGAKEILLGIGGSATNDGGTGMCRALGARFLTADGKDAGFGARCAERTARVELDSLRELLRGVKITAMCDVVNPLCGPEGATYVYGPQKGAVDLPELDAALNNLAEVAGGDAQDRPGAGAAGGLGFALMAFCGAELRSGIDAVLDLCEFERHCAGADLILTGEGRADGQSASGKVVSGILKRAGGIPVAVFAGGLGDGAERLYEAGISVLLPIGDRPMTLAESMARTEELLESAARRLWRALLVGRGLNK